MQSSDYGKTSFDIIKVGEMEDQKIILVIGKEGKSWFQSYIQSLYGNNRVARLDIINKTADLLHIMSRCILATTDIFLFNHQRCVPSEECCYALLEILKQLRFTPFTLMITLYHKKFFLKYIIDECDHFLCTFGH